MAKSVEMKASLSFWSRTARLFLLFLWTLVGCGGSDESNSSSGGKEPQIGTEREVRLTNHYDSVLSIGNPPMEFPYDARGQGITPGRITYKGDGRADLIFWPEDAVFELPGIPRDIAYIEIIAADHIGEIDFCTGEVFFSFDSKWQPVSFGVPLEPMSVVATETTGTASGTTSRGFSRTVTGRSMDESGDLRLVSVAVVPPTGDWWIDTLLGLDTLAVSELEVHFDFPDGRFPCPHDPPPEGADRIRMRVGKEGKLSMDLLGQYITYPYDGHGSDGTGAITDISNGILSVDFSDFVVPVMQFIPGLDMGVRIEPKSLMGEINACTGEIAFDFDADFYPFNGDNELYPMSVVTTLTSGESYYHHHTDFDPIEGEPLDKYGDAYLVGIADVPRVPPSEEGAALINLFLGLPNDAVSELPVHIDFLGGERPQCP